MDNLKEVVDTYSSWIFKIGLTIVFLSTLFLFTNTTSEFYDTPKFIILTIFSAVILILLTLKFTLSNKVVFLRTPLDLPLLLLLIIGVLATALSPTPYLSLLGNQIRIHGSLIALIIYVLFYFLLTNNLKSLGQLRWFISLITFMGGLLALVSLLTYFGAKVLPPPWVHGINFTPTGSNFSSTAILAMLVPIVVVQILHTTKLPTLLLNSTFLTLYGVTIALTGTWATWIAAFLGASLAFLGSEQAKELDRIVQMKQTLLLGLLGVVVPLTLVALITVLSFIPPIGPTQNPFYSQAKNFPKETRLDFVNSWKIAVSSFRDSPFWGTGPGTFLFNFTTYKPVEFNQKPYWNLRFETPFNEYLLILATLGGLGLFAFLTLTVLSFSAIYSALRLSRAPQENDRLKKALALASLVFFVILLLHASTLPVWITGLFVLAAFSVFNMLTSPASTPASWRYTGDLKQTLLQIAGNVSKTSSQETVRIETLPSVLLAVSVALVLFAFYFGGKIILADVHHRIALNAVAQNNGILAYNELVQAERLNPQNDLYRTDMAQTNLALANAIVLAKGPTEASPAGFLTDQDKQNIQILLQQAIEEGRNAVNLSPRSALNWEILAALYRQISGVAQNSLVFALDAYGRAIFQDPLNPILRLNVGGVYYAIKNYDLAIRFFTDAINLKPDFANGYYNLSVALRDKGDLQSAQAAAERILQVVQPDSADYQVASDYLSDLKNRIATGSAQASPIQPPAAQTTGALQQKELPKVVDVGTPPEKIATPEAVKKPSPTPSPRP